MMCQIFKGPEKWLLFSALCLVSCSPKIIPTTTQMADSTRIEYREKIVRDTAYIEVPVEIEKIVTRDSTSHLENSIARSDAAVIGGVLQHTLETKPQKISMPVTIVVRDTMILKKTNSSETKIIEVEKPLSKAQKRQIDGFWILLALVGLFGFWRIYKIIR